LIGLVATGLLGVAVLAGVIFKLQTKDGTLIVEVNQPDAVVTISNEEGKVEISEPGASSRFPFRLFRASIASGSRRTGSLPLRITSK